MSEDRGHHRRRTDAHTADPESVRIALRQFATGIAVVTVRFAEELYGITISAFVPVSLNPPVVLISVGSRSRVVPAIRKAGEFAVHILDAEQQSLAERFSIPQPGEEQFRGLRLEPGLGTAPMLCGTLARFECVLLRTCEVGTHTLVLGTIVGVESNSGKAEPLIYYHQNYARLGSTL